MKQLPLTTVEGGQTLAPPRADLVVVIDTGRLKAACVARGWSLSELARQAKVSRPTLAAALQGKPLRPQTAWKIGRALSHGDVPTELLGLVVKAS